ncbi:MAG: ATP-binding protein [Desulfatibacillaceae bacterium]
MLFPDNREQDDMAGLRATLKLKNTCSELGRIAARVEELAEERGLPPKTVFDLHLAIEEHFTNVINHGLDVCAECEVTMNISMDTDAVVIVIEDPGTPFNPMAADEPDLTGPAEERKEGGLGLHLIRKVMDEIHYERREDKNVFTMIKRIR